MKWYYGLVLAVLMGCGNANTARYHQEGREAALDGLPADACPYEPGHTFYNHWKRGWAEGYKTLNATKATQKATKDESQK